MSRDYFKVAVVGGGAIAQHQHLPCLAHRKDCRVTALVERDRTRALQLAQRFDIPGIYSDYNDLSGLDIDAAIITLPNHLHAPASIDLLRAGIHVLVEKPMALSMAECEAMLAAAEAGQAILAVGLMRRFSPGSRFARWAITSGLLGPIVSFDIQDGFIYSWAVTTDFFLRKELAGGGVLIDLGVHTLDQMLWWLGDVASFEYYDDNYGGVEADCRLNLTLQSGATGVVEVSRTRDLRNTAIIRGERAELEIALVKNYASLRFPDGETNITGSVAFAREAMHRSQKVADLITAEHEDFFQAIKTGQPPLVSGVEGRRSLALVEACYAERRLLQLPWLELQQSARLAEETQ